MNGPNCIARKWLQFGGPHITQRWGSVDPCVDTVMRYKTHYRQVSTNPSRNSHWTCKATQPRPASSFLLNVTPGDAVGLGQELVHSLDMALHHDFAPTLFLPWKLVHSRGASKPAHTGTAGRGQSRSHRGTHISSQPPQQALPSPTQTNPPIHPSNQLPAACIARTPLRPQLRSRQAHPWSPPTSSGSRRRPGPRSA